MGKYDEVLRPFVAMMEKELYANAGKGDRPGWLQMDSKTAILEVFYHMGKLHQAVHRGEAEAIKEYAADVANMCMMLVDVCRLLPVDEQPAPVAVDDCDLKALMDRHEAWKAGEANGIASMVMPDFDTWYVKNRGVIGTAIYKNERKVWNACLDEFARLNLEQKP